MPHLSSPFAYHITFGTYASRLHGDARPTVDRQHNQYGAPFLERDDQRRRTEQAELRFGRVQFSLDQRISIEALIPSICERGGWTYHACACGPDHVHVLISTDQDGKAVRKWLKRWLGEALTERLSSGQARPWWAEGGSVRWIWMQEYLAAAHEYIAKQRATPPPEAERVTDGTSTPQQSRGVSPRSDD